MIKVTLGEVKTQDEKPFPKLMIGVRGVWEGCVCFFEKEREGMILGPNKFGLARNFNMEYFTDYNEPITLQNL